MSKDPNDCPDCVYGPEYINAGFPTRKVLDMCPEHKADREMQRRMDDGPAGLSDEDLRLYNLRDRIANETWEPNHDSVYDPRGRQTIAFGPMADEDVALCAAAPDMARLLLKIRQTYVPDGDAVREIHDVLRKAGVFDALPDWCKS
jgi:hypothetical protein